MVFETLQVHHPEMPVVRQPVVDVAERIGLQFANPLTAALALGYQAGILQHAKVFIDSRAAEGKLLGQSPDRLTARAKSVENLSARRIG